MYFRKPTCGLCASCQIFYVHILSQRRSRKMTHRGPTRTHSKGAGRRISQDLASIERMRQFTGVHPAFSDSGRPSLASIFFPLEDSSLPVSPLPHPFTDLLVNLFFLNNDSTECSNATTCFHSSHLHSFRPRAPASALHPSSAVVLSEPRGSILMCFSPLASLKHVYMQTGRAH